MPHTLLADTHVERLTTNLDIEVCCVYKVLLRIHASTDIHNLLTIYLQSL